MRLAETGPFGLVVSRPDDVIETINTTMLGWLGLERGDVVGLTTLPDLLAPGDRIYHETHIRPMLEMGTGVKEIAVQFARADGSRLSALMNADRRIEAETGEARFETVVIDATERRRYEQELLHERKHAQASEARLEVMYDVASGLAGAATVAEILDVTAERGGRWVDGASCAVWLFEQDLHFASRRAGGGGRGPAQLSLESPGPALEQLLAGDLVVIDGRDTTGQEFPLIHQQLVAAGRRSAMVAPLRIDDQLRGVLTYGFDDLHDFDEAERRSVRSLATQAEQALQRVLSIDAENRSRGRLESVYRFTSRVAGALSVDQVLDAMASVSGDLVSAVASRIAVLEEDRAAVRIVRSAAERGQPLVALSSPAISCEAIRTGEPAIVASSTDLRERYPASPVLAEGDFGCVIAVPLSKEGDVLGAWTFAYPEVGLPDDDEVTLLRLLAEQASHAIDRAATHEAEVTALARADVRLAISESLNAAVGTDDVASAVIAGGRSAFDASYLAVYLPEGGRTTGRLRRIAHVGLDEEIGELSETLELAEPLVAAASETLAPTYVIDAGDSILRGTPFVSMDWAWAVFLPMSISGNLDGLIVLGFDAIDSLTAEARTALAGLTAEASTALVRARKYDLEHEVAVTLQRSLLQLDLPSVPGWSISAGYDPGSDHLEVGGDLFDVTVASDGDIIVLVGDVVGHGLGAAAAMGELRSAARALALVSANPLEVIRGLNRFAIMAPGVKGATVACVRISPDGTASYACAGHPYPVVCRDDGSAELLYGGRSAMLGVADGPVTAAEFTLDVGSSLVVYTDGLVERRGVAIDIGIDHLRTHLARAQKERGEVVANDVLRQILRDSPSDDDTVIVCLSRLSTSS